MARHPAGGDIREEPAETDDNTRRLSWARFISAAVMGVLIGAIAAWAVTNIGGSMLVFVVAAAASGYYLYQKPLASSAIGTGLYLTAGLLVLTPILFYLPTILGYETGTGPEEAGTFIGSILGLLLWGFVFLLVALVLFTLGYFINKRAEKKLPEGITASGDHEA